MLDTLTTYLTGSILIPIKYCEIIKYNGQNRLIQKIISILRQTKHIELFKFRNNICQDFIDVYPINSEYSIKIKYFYNFDYTELLLYVICGKNMVHIITIF